MRAVRAALGAAAAMALPPAEAIAVAQAVEALTGRGFRAPRLSPRLRQGVALGVVHGLASATLLGACLPH